MTDSYITQIATLAKVPESTVEKVLDTSIAIMAVQMIKGESPSTPLGKIVKIKGRFVVIKMDKEIADLLNGDIASDAVVDNLVCIF